jgi:hypothetical protein
MPKADATGLAPEESADYTPSRTPFVGAGGFGLLRFRSSLASTFRRYTPQPARQVKIKSISWVKSRTAEALGLKREDRPAAFVRRSESQFCLAILRLGYRSCLHIASIRSHSPAPVYTLASIRQDRNPRKRAGNGPTPRTQQCHSLQLGTCQERVTDLSWMRVVRVRRCVPDIRIPANMANPDNSR